MPTPVDAGWAWVAIAAAAPILAHLLRPRPAPPIVLPGLMLLAPASRPGFTRHSPALAHLRRIARLLIRSAALAGLAWVLVVAPRPEPRAVQPPDPRAPVVIILDASASTARIPPAAPAQIPFFETLRAEAARLIDRAEREARPVTLAIHHPEGPIATDAASARALLATAQPRAAADLDATVLAAVAAASAPPEFIHILTDHQATEHEAFAGADFVPVRWFPSSPPSLAPRAHLSAIELLDAELVHDDDRAHWRIRLRLPIETEADVDPAAFGVRLEARAEGLPPLVLSAHRSLAELHVPADALPSVIELHASVEPASPGAEHAQTARGELRPPRARRWWIDPALAPEARAAFEAAALHHADTLAPTPDRAGAFVLLASTIERGDAPPLTPAAPLLLVLDQPPSVRTRSAFALPPIPALREPREAALHAVKPPLLLAELALGRRHTAPMHPIPDAPWLDQQADPIAHALPADSARAHPVLLLHADMAMPSEPSPWLPVFASELLRTLAPTERWALEPTGLPERERDPRPIDRVPNAETREQDAQGDHTVRAHAPAIMAHDRPRSGLVHAIAWLAACLLAMDVCLGSRGGSRP